MYYCDVDATVESVQNCPTTHAFSLFVEIGAASEVVQTLKTWHDGNGYKTTVYVRSKYPEWGAGWQKLATATPPQEFTAPLSDGYSGALSYLKTQESIVIVSFDVYKTDNSTINGANLISTLPEGFRGVSGYCVALATGVGGGSVVGAAQAWCDTEGIVRTLSPSGTYRIRGEIVFCAN